MGIQTRRGWSHYARWTALAAGLLLLGPTVGRADIVVTTEGRFEGDVISEDQDMVMLRTDEGIKYFARGDITSVVYPDFPNDSAKVREVFGQAEYKRSAQIVWAGSAEGRWLELTRGTTLRPGDWIRTGADGKVIATVAGQAIMAIEPNTEMTIAALRKNKQGDMRVRLSLQVGQLWNDVGSLPSKQSQYVVETPAASCGVRGTVYTVMVEDDETTVGTVDGTVLVVQKNTDADEVEVGANEQVTLERSGAVAQAAISGDFLRQWGDYEKLFNSMRGWMRFDAMLARFGLTRQQGFLVAGGLGAVIIVLGVVMITRRRK